MKENCSRCSGKGHHFKKIYVDSCHLNNEGNAIAAGAVFELLKEQWEGYIKRAR